MRHNSKFQIGAAVLSLVLTGAVVGGVAAQNQPILSYGILSMNTWTLGNGCSWVNYGADIYDPNYAGHITKAPTTSNFGLNGYLPNDSQGLKLSSSSKNGSFTLETTTGYKSCYVWAGGWKNDAVKLSVNGQSLDVASNSLIGDFDSNVYYDKYAFNFEQSTTEWNFEATKRLVIGAIAWYNEPLTSYMVEEDGPVAPVSSETTEPSEPEVPVEPQGPQKSILTFEKACGGSGVSNDDVNWTIASDAAESSYDSTKGIHYGTNKAAVTYIRLSTSDIKGVITKVKINASTATGVVATVDVTVGGKQYGGEAQSLTANATEYTFIGESKGNIIVTITKPISAVKALYCKSIEVTC